MKNFRLIASLVPLVVVGAGVLAAIAWQLGFFRYPQQWTISTGTASGNYHQLGSQLARILDNQLRPHHRFELASSAGSAENMERIGNGEADFAFVQSNASAVPNARLIATLYDEVLHILVRSDLLADDSFDESDEGTMPLELLAKLDHVSLGPLGSGTNQVAELLLKHFEIELQSPGLHVATDDLHALFDKGQLDVAFVLAAPGSQYIDDLLETANLSLMPVGKGDFGGTPIDAFALLHPTFHASVIPSRLYGRQPNLPVQTIGVSALLIASEAVDYQVVRQVTRRLFTHRNQLFVGERTPLKFSPETANTNSSIPFHAGAEAFYHRENPSFLVVYAEVIALGITLLVGLWSIVRLFLRWLADVKKERIDQFYLSVREAAHLDGPERLTTLHEIHEQAFDQLMREQLIANESFVIFHDYLLSEIARAEKTV